MIRFSQIVFEQERALYGTSFNPTKTMAYCPRLRPAKALYASIEQLGLFPKGLVALVYLRVASLNGCPF